MSAGKKYEKSPPCRRNIENIFACINGIMFEWADPVINLVSVSQSSVPDYTPVFAHLQCWLW